MKRREVIQLLAALPAAAYAGRLFAAPASSPRFLLVFLRGGYDCANVLVPYTSQDYYGLRPSIAVAKPGSRTDGKDAIALDSDWALTPALRDTMGALYRSGELSFVPFAGTTDLSRSHFETQDAIELGQFSQGAHDFSSGFMARLASQLADAKPIAFTDTLPVAFRGTADIPNISLKGAGRAVFDQRQAGILTGMYAGSRLQGAVSSGLELRQEVGQAMEQEMKEANRDAITPKGFELEAQRVARLMRDQYRIGFIDVGGWDTHVNEGAGDGQLATNLVSLAQGLQAFRQELGPEWKNTVVVVLSEFGRTFRENGDKGTDHGHGSVYWVLGGSINGGKILGEQVAVSRANLFQDRDFPVLTDYRSLLGGLFTTLWGIDGSRLEQVFPQSTALDLKLV
jgi:uncharacterized protein (DUF1501 family)